MAKNEKSKKKSMPQDAVVKGPNKEVPAKKLPANDCANQSSYLRRQLGDRGVV